MQAPLSTGPPYPGILATVPSLRPGGLSPICTTSGPLVWSTIFLRDHPDLQEAVDDRRTGKRVPPGPHGTGRRRGHRECRGDTGRLRHGPDPHAGRAGGIPAPKRGASPDDIVCLSLTEGGAADLLRRLELHPEIAGQSRFIYVGTFHEYANDILRDGGAAALGLPPDYTAWDQQRALETLALNRRFRQPDLLPALRWYGLNQARWARFPGDPAAGAPLAGHRGLSCLREELAARPEPGRPAGGGHPGVGAG